MIEIIPAIDLIDGKCVRLSQGDYAQKTIYNENPLEVAKEFEAAGIRRLHLVDLDGAKAGQIKNLPVLEKIASQTSLIVDFGGGVKTTDNFQSVLDAGAQYVAVGSVAVKQPEVFKHWIETFSADKILLGTDVKEYKLAVAAWTETTGINIFDFLEEKIKQGISTVFSTDISRDGMLTGVAIDLYSEIHRRFPDLKLIASGGVSSVKDIYEAEKAGCSGIIIGKAIYEGKIQLKDLV
ncbi:MAG: 1-(5-phosphoribosyl)-5-[(5-phosphoribosylamino)methylideneamino]imidazole-4-carboxamide isomerase [Bacteroidales bacterium]|nr:1-(5-phosphoribosyl)-5-[(5-phosphoribosylamino)methylideneamino]imidazole-4-carboxamide isomerase [Bacteroidales bacterium]